jgi:hypothetical protein
MAVNNVLFRQNIVIKFHLKENNYAENIYDRHRYAYCECCMGNNSVRRWVKHFKDGNWDIADLPRCRRPRTDTTERNE